LLRLFILSTGKNIITKYHFEEMSSDAENNRKNAAGSDEIDLIQVFLKIWGYRRFIIIFTSIVITGAVVYSLISQEMYEAEVSLYQVQNKASGGGRLASIASQFGMGGRLGEAPDYNLKDLLMSRKMFREVVLKEWETGKYDSLVNLITFWGIEGETAGKIEKSAYERYKGMLTFNEDEESGLKTIKVMIAEPQLAADVANFIPEFMSRYIQHEEKTNTKENLTYIQERLKSVRQELEKAEEELKEFRENNRVISSSPELQLEMGRLERKVTIKQEVYLTLQQEEEMAMIDLVKETPVINVLDKAVKPPQRAKPKRKLIVIIGAFAGFFLSVLFVVFFEVYKYVRKAMSEYEQS